MLNSFMSCSNVILKLQNFDDLAGAAKQNAYRFKGVAVTVYQNEDKVL